VTVPLAADLGYDVDRLLDAVTPRTKVVLLATPNNPTGVAMTTKEIARIAEAVGDGVIVVVDEAYREFLDPASATRSTELVPSFPNVLVTRTMSKAHGLAGLRLGYAIGHPDVVNDIDKTLVPFAVNALAQVAALAAIEHDQLISRSGAGDPRRTGAGRSRACAPPAGRSRTTRRTSCGSRSETAPTPSPSSWRSAASWSGPSRRGHPRHDRDARAERPLPHLAGRGREPVNRPWFPGDPRAVGEDPDYRFTLANERTFLAWIRTALALAAGGLGAVTILDDFPGEEVLGIGLLTLSVLTAWTSYRRWALNERAMRLDEPLPPSRLPLLMAIGVAIVALAAAVLFVVDVS
jgi:putative membrane protein